MRLFVPSAEFESYGLFRYMGLSDLMGEIKTDVQSFSGDEAMESKVLNQVLKLVEDKISEVKNQAVKWCVAQLPAVNYQHLH